MLKYLFALIVLLLSAARAEAATYYMSNGTHGETSASNANPCTGGGGNNAQNILYPKRWLTNTGGAGALSCLAAGDTLLIRGGTYDDGFEAGYNGITLASGTSWSNKIRIANYPNGCSPRVGTVSCGTPGEDVIIAPTARYTYSGNTISLGLFAVVQYVEFDGINIDNSVAAAGNLDGEVGLVCHNDGPHVMGANYIRIQNADMVGNKGAYIEGGGGSAGGGDHFGVFKSEAAGCPGFHEFKNLRIHGGATNEVGWFANSTPGTYGRYTAYAFYLAADNTTIENNDIYDTRYLGMQIYASGLAINGTVVRNNKWHDIVRGGYKSGSGSSSVVVIIDTGTGSLIYNNVMYNNGTPDGAGLGIQCYDGASGGKYYHNTIYGSTGTGLITTAGCSGATFTNNISYLNAGGNYSNGGSGTTATTNLFGVDPTFVNAGAQNFHLDTGSTAINTGTCLSAVLTDYDGDARPSGGLCDIGFDEWVAAGAVPGLVSCTPANGATGVDLFTSIICTSSGATSFDVYFGLPGDLGTSLVSDTFTAANGSDIGTGWTPYAAAGITNATLVSNRIRTVTPSAYSVEASTYTFVADQWCRVQIVTLSNSSQNIAGCLLRGSAPSTLSGYLVGMAGTNQTGSWIARVTNGLVDAYLALESTTVWAVNDRVQATAVGNVISLYRYPNATPILTVTDTSYSNGRVGLVMSSQVTGAVEIDNFEAGNLGLTFVGNQASGTYVASNLVPNTVYHYQFIAKNAVGSTTGPENSFTTLGATAVAIGVRLRCIHGTANCP
jgi:hypothetical protein